jgi:YfiR/HmsC-like
MAGYRAILRILPAAALALALLGAVGSSRAFAEAPGYSQDQIEAAFLYRFVGFVHWPEGAHTASARKASFFTVAVLDDAAVAGDLERLLPSNELQGKHLRVRSIRRIDELGDAQILYIGESDERVLRRWLAQVADRPVLVVTNQPGGLDAGSTINFLVVDRHVRFEISLAAAKRAGLNISADLLSVAMHVEGRPVGSEAPCDIAPPAFEPRSCAPVLASR